MFSSALFEHLLCCRGCNRPILVGNQSAVSSAVPGKAIGLVIRHGDITEGKADIVSSLQMFPFEGVDASQQCGPGEPGVSRQVIYMEHCTKDRARHDFARQWGLRWLNFEKHFEAIAGYFGGSNLGECPCPCHYRDNGAADNRSDDCGSVDTTGAVFVPPSPEYYRQRESIVGQPNGPPRAKEAVGRKTVRWADQPEGWPSEGRKRARSEDVAHSDLYILSWREQCRRASN